MEKNLEDLLITYRENDKKNIVMEKRKKISNFIRYLKSIEKNFDGDTMKIRDFVFDELDKQLKDYIVILSTELIQKEVNTLDILNNNPHILKKYYEELKDLDLKDFDLNENKNELNGNEESAKAYEVKVLLQSVRTEKDTIDPIMMKFGKKIYECKDPKEKAKYLNELEKDPELKKIYQYVEIFLQGSEEDKVKKYVTYRLQKAQDMLKENEKRRLKEAGKFFKKYGLLEEMIKKTNNDYEEIGLSEMKYQTRTEGIQEDIGVENIFEDEYIETLDEEQLEVLNAYWQNRYTKEAKNIKETLFIMENLQLWGQILNDNILDNITDDDLWNSVQKIEVCNKVFKEVKKQATAEERIGPNILCNVINLDKIDPNFKEQYEKYFNQAFPQKSNDFIGDFIIGQSSRNIIDIIYGIKNTNIKQLLLNIERNSKITNWGYIEEKRSGGNSIKRKKENILIGIDYPGFNIPIKLHTNREELLEYYKDTKENTIIPIYEGAEYTKFKGKMKTRALLMPLTEKRESFIIKMNKQAKAIDSNYIFIKHLGNLVTKKAKGIEKIYPRKYVNLETGEIGYKVKGEFIVEDEETKDKKEQKTQ